MRRRRPTPRWPTPGRPPVGQPAGRQLAACCLLAGVGLLAGCGGVSAEEERRQLADDLVAETGGALDDEQADCVAAELQAAYAGDSFRQVIDAAENGDDEDPVRIRVIDIFAECDALEAITDTGG